MRLPLRLSHTFLGLSWIAAWGAVPLLGAGISVGELNYNDPEGADFDFIELVNTGGPSVPLQGLTFTRGVGYTFARDETLAAGERIVVVRNRSKFLARYGTGIRLADGTFSGGFAAEGERVTLMNSGGGPWWIFPTCLRETGLHVPMDREAPWSRWIRPGI